MMSNISMEKPFSFVMERLRGDLRDKDSIKDQIHVWFPIFLSNFLAKLHHFFRNFYKFLLNMALQDINLEFQTRRLIYLRRWSNKRHMRIGLSLWGVQSCQEDKTFVQLLHLCQGTGVLKVCSRKITEKRRFQFVYLSEKAMDTVMRRGPWAFDDRMLVLLKWTPLMELELLNFIMFLIQVRGIPLQFMNHEVIHHIVRAMGEYIQMEYNEEAGGRWNFSE